MAAQIDCSQWIRYSDFSRPTELDEGTLGHYVPSLEDC